MRSFSIARSWKATVAALPAPIKQAKPRVPVILFGAKTLATQVAICGGREFSISKQENDHQLLLSRLDSLIRFAVTSIPSSSKSM